MLNLYRVKVNVLVINAPAWSEGANWQTRSRCVVAHSSRHAIRRALKPFNVPTKLCGVPIHVEKLPRPSVLELAEWRE